MTDSPSDKDKDPPASGDAPSTASPSSSGDAPSTASPPSTPTSSFSGDAPSTTSPPSTPSPSSSGDAPSTGGVSAAKPRRKILSLARLFGDTSSSGDAPSPSSSEASIEKTFSHPLLPQPPTPVPQPPSPPLPPEPPLPLPKPPIFERLFGRRFAEWFRDIRRFWKVIGTAATVVAAIVGLTNLTLKLADPSPARAYAFYEWWHDFGRDKIVEIDSEIKNPRFLFSLERLKDDRLSTRGDAEQSTYDLEVLHSWGGHEKDCDESERVSDKKWREVLTGLKKAADVGYVNAQNTLGVLYWCGLVVEQKQDLAIKWWQTADNQGSKHAQHNLAVAYWKEKDIYKGPSPWEEKQFSDNRYVAISYWTRSVEKKLKEAQYNLANIYWERATKDSKMKAVDLYEQASKQGHHLSRFYLGRAYMLGLGVESKNKEKAIDLWENVAVANLDFAPVHYNLAVAHANGEGVDNKDLEQAKIWLEKVVGSREETDDSGDYAHADFMLGNLHLLASENNFSRLANSTGLLGLLEYFNYNRESYSEATKRYKKADSKGYAPAQYYLAFLYWDGKTEATNGDDPNKEAIKLLKEAADYCLAQHALGLAYWWGEGVEKNRDTAHELLQKVSAQGLAESYYYLARYHYDKSEESEGRDSNKSDDDKNDDDKSDDNRSDDDKNVAQYDDIEKAYKNYIISYNLGYEKKHTKKQIVRIEKILDVEGKGDSEIKAIREKGEALADDIKEKEVKNCT